MSGSTLKKLGLVCGFLIALWLTYLYRQIPHGKTPFAKVADSAVQIVRQQGPKTVQLSKETGSWQVQLAAGGTAPAEDSEVRQLLSALKEVQLEDEISDRADRASEFQVDEVSGTRITLKDVKGGLLGDGIFGKQAPDAMHLYLRFPDQPNVYLARGLFPEELGKADPNDWRRKELVNLPETRVQSIHIESNGVETNFVRVSTDAWTMNGKPADMAALNAVIGNLSHLKADGFIDLAAYPGLTYESLKLARVVVRSPETSVELHIGIMDARTKRYPVSIGKDAGLAWLSQPTVDSILKIKRS